jgi:hypothetical protein
MLSEYFDQVMVFLETVEPQSAGINEYVRKLHSCSFTRGVAMDEQSVALTAQENYLNIRACHTRTTDENPPELGRFDERQRTIDMQAFYWVKTLFDPTSPEIKQFENPIKIHPELGTYSEFVLYLFQTRSRSPVVTWSKVEDNLTHYENQLIHNFHDHLIAAVQERLKACIEEHKNFQFLTWQVLVSKMCRYAVKASSKRSVEWLDSQVLTFLLHAQDGDTVPVPDIDALANGMLNIMSEDKEHSELKKDNRRVKSVSLELDGVRDSR